MMENKEFYYYLLKDSKENFKGWDFSYLNQTNRMVEFPLPWNYTIEVLHYLQDSVALLDMGTGGGEFLSTLPFPNKTCATEGYQPNIPIAKKLLEPLGIKVYSIDSDEELPFKNESFDLIINRHESFDTKELQRILKTNGIFITQQVGGKNDSELNQLFETEESSYSFWNLQTAIKDLQKENFTIIKQLEEITKTRFYDIGAIIFYLKAIPWQIPDFSVSKYNRQLMKIHEYIQDKGFLDIACHRFLIIGRK